jgi:hypothetical protein
MRMLRVSIVCAVSALSGCAINVPIGGNHHVHVSAPEEVFQTLNAVDFATTVSIARKPRCYEELGTPTEDIIGKHPTEGKVYAYWAVYSAAHLATSSWLDREVDSTDARGWKIAQRAFQVFSIADAAYSVQRNWRMGLRPFQGTGDCALPDDGKIAHGPPRPRA